ncbi:MAG: AMP-binding protein [candidate division Zixibacteria bacterium]|nr:AMP-binding protein [candidate division Zixibacteria bacterium]
MVEVSGKKELKDLTIPEMLKRSAEFFPNSIALSAWKNEGFRSITYSELEAKVSLFARGLNWLGIRKIEKVGVLSENRPEWGIAYLGILRSGGVVVPLDPLLKCSEIEVLVRDSGMKGLVTSNKFIAELLETTKKIPGFEFLICVDETRGEGIFSFSEIIAKGKDNDCRFPEVVPEDVAVIIYTSGTTGKSKGVMLTHKNIMSDVWGTREALKLYPEDNFLSVLPLHHTLECTAGLLIPLSGGSRVTYARSLKSKEILEDMKNARATLLIGVPLLYEKLFTGLKKNIQKKSLFTRLAFKICFILAKISKKSIGMNLGKIVFKNLRKKAGLSSIRILICGAAPLPAVIPECFDLLGIKFLQGYGLTETSPVLTLNPYSEPKYLSVGKAIPGAELKIFEPDKDGVGEIIAKGDMVMKGYCNNQEETEKVLKDGWLYTGDLGWKDKEGYFYIAGRKKNVIVTSAGKNVYPEEVENQLLQSPYILEALVLGRKVAEGVEEVEAVIVPNYEYIQQISGDQARDEEKIKILIKDQIAKCCQGIADYKRVKHFRIRQDEFEKTSTRKIKRFLFKPNI